jgi:hypothetical protein
MDEVGPKRRLAGAPWRPTPDRSMQPARPEAYKATSCFAAQVAELPPAEIDPHRRRKESELGVQVDAPAQR